MDSEKDAARSKWRLTQRHKRGRGGGGAGGRGGRSGGGQRGQQNAVALGTNDDRFSDEEGGEGLSLGGPVRRSQGADLADLLERTEPHDLGLYYHARSAPAAEDWGPPPGDAAAGHQGLSIDLKGLAACLALLPLNRLLDTDAFSDEDEDGAGSRGAAPAAAPEAAAAAAGAGAAAPLKALSAGRAHPSTVPSSSAVPLPPQPSGGAAAAGAGGSGGDDELDALLAGLGAPGGAAPAAGAAAAAGRLGRLPVQPAAAAAAAAAAAGRGDDDLDFLLGSGAVTGRPPSGAEPVRPPGGPPPPAGSGLSLEDFLDSL